MAYLSVSNLSLDYQTRQENMTPALRDINFSLEQGLICALMGPSGGGKSTLLHILAGVLGGYNGEVTLGGDRIDAKKHQIALVPQNYGLLPWKTIEENILLPNVLGRRSLTEQERSDIIGALGLDALLQRYPHEISGGQRQRVALARAFCMKPDLLLLDEPFSALDVVTGERSRNLFRELWQRYPTTTLLVTHNPTEALALADRMLVIGGKPGQIIADLPKVEEAKLRDELNKAYGYGID